MAQCYKNSLALAVKHGVKTIAFPSISTGIYGFPMERAAQISATEIKQFLEQDQTIEKVTLVCFGHRAYTIHFDAVKAVFSNEG